MFKKEISKRKIIATCLIFCFVFTNCFTLFSNINFAETNELGKQYSENVSSNVKYDVTFMQNEETKGYEYEGAIEEKNLALNIKAEVKNEGYLKNAKILIEAENGLSFEILKDSSENYQINGNQIELTNISAGEKLDLIIPIEYKESEKLDNLNKKINAKLIGIYVNKSGEEKSISETITLRLIWNTNTEFNLTSDLTKFIPYASDEKKGVIIQTNIKSGIPTTNSFVKKEELEVEAIKIDGYSLEKVFVTNKSDEELLNTDWKYDEENNKINIKVEKESETIKSNELLITYVFSGEEDIELPFSTTSKINGTIFMFGTDETTNAEVEAKYEVNEKIGEIVTVEAEQQESTKIGNLMTNTLNQEKEYKINYENEFIVDISSTSMLENILIKDIGEEFENEKEKFETKTSYYKTIIMSKENFEKILGQDGKVEILNSNSEVIGTINKETKIDDENNYYINFEKFENTIVIKTSKPISEGILIIKANKEMVESEYSIEQLQTFSNINSKYTASVIYSGNIENKISDIETKMELIKPQTKAEISLSRKNLSTITENNDIKMTIELNNTNEDIDLYKNPSFEIEFPEYVEDVKMTDIAIANSEDVFKIVENNIYKSEAGRIILKIKLEGNQTKYNSNDIANGTNIVMNLNIKLNLYAPSKQEKIEMRYINENATSYENKTEDGIGYNEVEVEYKAPTGVVSVNKISNYNDEGSTVVSVEQGTVTDKIEIFDDAKIATMDILVMNNNTNNCNDIKILGRIPFKGNKDIVTGKDLGTTENTTIIEKITENAGNLASSTIYYSSNPEATEDLNAAENKWKTEVENLDEVKSYLIVLNDYEMKTGEVLRYSYKFRIPENLEHNTYLYGTFKTTYNNLNEVATTKETSTPDIVGLTTGVGPQLSVQTIANVKESVKEYEKIKYSILIENTGTEIAEDVVVKVKIPDGATLVSHATYNTVEEAKGWTLRADREISTTIDKISPNETRKIEFFVQANKLPSIEEYYSNAEGFTKNEDGTYSIQEKYIENGETKYKELKITDIPEIVLVCEATITAKDLAKEIKTSDSGVKVEKSKIVAEETISTEESIAKVNENIEAKIQIKNNTDETMNNIIVTKVLPEGLKYAESYVRGYESDGVTLKKINTTNYDVETKTITWEVESLEPGRTVILVGNFIVGEMKDNVYKDTISTVSTIKIDGEEYQAGQVDITIGRPALTIEQTSNKANQYVKVGDEIQYIFNVKNIGSVRAENVMFKDILPEDVKITKLVYTADNIEVSKVVAKNEDATVYTSILPESNMEVKITAKVKDISVKEKTIENIAEVQATNVETISSNEIVNIIERTIVGNESSNSTNINKDTGNSKNEQKDSVEEKTEDTIKTKYEFKGTVWLDTNKNGKRDSSEKKISGIEVKLIDAITGEKIEEVATSQDGEYEFSNLENGAYIAIFYYDTGKYALTEYKKKGVSEDKNSDVISAVEVNKNIATTDAITIKNGSKSNIDMGLVEATTFDLSLTKTITKVTVQSTNGTKSYDFDNEDLAKVDINAKYLNGAKVFVEYTFTVKNEGEVEGYAKKIVDYMPKELEFSTDLNKNWYAGNDGNLYSEELSETAIAAGGTRSIKLVLTKNMTETNTGIVNNQAEIAESYNKLGLTDIDSDANDRDQKDDDMSAADLIIGVKTGETLIYFSVIIAIVIAAIIAIIVIKKSKIILKIQLKIGKEV